MRRFIIVALLLLPSLFCAYGLPVTLLCPEELTAVWKRIVAANPLPAGFMPVPPKPGNAREPERIIVHLGGEPGGAGGRAVARVLTAPVGLLGGQPPAVSRIAPLESILLPYVALPVQGMTADNPGYPLQSEVVIELRGGNPDLRAWLDALPAPPERARPADIAWIGAVGDIMPARGVDSALLSADGLANVFGDTLPILRSCAFLVGNLEAAATARGEPARKSYTFRFSGKALEPLARAGFRYLSLANNHSFDFGAAGFLDTISALEKAGIGTSGAGVDEQAAAVPFATRVEGQEIRVLSFSAYPVDRRGFDGRKSARARENAPGALWLDDRGLAAAAAGFSPQAFNMALVHGGEEWSSRPTAEQERMYRALVEAGADVVIGSHPHVLQAIEADRGRLIAWSLGNFLFPGMGGTPGGEESAIVRIGVLNGRILYVQSYPVHLSGTRVRLADRTAPLPPR
jgi:poly-gamma-glutamate capsule biosynthesis protein CapA/YwtB (metallophosphatase superfamily)